MHKTFSNLKGFLNFEFWGSGCGFGCLYSYGCGDCSVYGCGYMYGYGSAYGNGNGDGEEYGNIKGDGFSDGDSSRDGNGRTNSENLSVEESNA